MNLYCNDPVPAFVQDLCANEPSRVIAVAYIRADNTTLSGYTTAAEWINGIANGTITIIKNVRGEKPKSSPVTKPGFGRQKTFTVGYERSLTYEHPDVVGNEGYYDAMNFNNSYRIAYFTQGGLIWVPQSTDVVNVDADHVVSQDSDDIIIWNVAVKWSAQKMHKAYTAPAGVFE